MKHILLVDDEVHFAEALAERLFYRGFKTSVAFNVQMAMDLLDSETFDGAILDIRLPDGNGIDVLRAVRDQCPDMRVLMLSGHGTDEDRKLCLALGAYAFINKPAKVDELAAHLQAEEVSQ